MTRPNKTRVALAFISEKFIKLGNKYTFPFIKNVIILLHVIQSKVSNMVKYKPKKPVLSNFVFFEKKFYIEVISLYKQLGHWPLVAHLRTNYYLCEKRK